MTRALEDSSLEALSPSMKAEQAAYQALLRLRAREHEVIRGNQPELPAIPSRRFVIEPVTAAASTVATGRTIATATKPKARRPTDNSKRRVKNGRS